MALSPLVTVPVPVPGLLTVSVVNPVPLRFLTAFVAPVEEQVTLPFTTPVPVGINRICTVAATEPPLGVNPSELDQALVPFGESSNSPVDDEQVSVVVRSDPVSEDEVVEDVEPTFTFPKPKSVDGVSEIVGGIDVINAVICPAL